MRSKGAPFDRLIAPELARNAGHRGRAEESQGWGYLVIVGRARDERVEQADAAHSPSNRAQGKVE